MASSTWIVDNCLKSDLVKGRTVILVVSDVSAYDLVIYSKNFRQTHNVALAGPAADFIVSVGLNGSIVSMGTDVSVPLKADPTLAAEATAEASKAVAIEQSQDQPKEITGKLIMAEEIAYGHVSWKSLKLLIDGLGGEYPNGFFAFLCACIVALSALQALEPWFLGFWGSQYETHPASEVNAVLYVIFI